MAVQLGMSALPSKADMRGATRDVRFVPIADIGGSLDHLIGALLEVKRNVESERLGGREIDDQLEFGRQLNRKIAWLLAFEYARNIDTGTAISIRDSGTITHQPTGLRVLAPNVDCGNPVERRQLNDLTAPTC